MDPATSARWNEWLHAGISARLSERINDFAEISGEFVAERENAIRDDHKRELAALRLELDGLRVEIARLKHDDDAKVIDLPALPRRAA